MRAAEETSTSEAEATESTQSGSEDSAPPPEPSALERAREALQQDSVDKSALEAALADLEAQLSSSQERASAAETRVSSLESSAAVSKDQFLRLNADFENFRRRTATEKEALRDSVRGDIVTSLLPVIDNFELARTQVKAETESEIKINNSYQSLYKQFVEFLRGLGVEAVPGEGSTFDPMLHEAIMSAPDDSVPDGTILSEFRKGFKLGDKLLRAAMVKVSTSDAPPTPLPAEE